MESDEKSNRIQFRCKKVVGDQVNLTALTLRVNYQNANGVWVEQTDLSSIFDTDTKYVKKQ